MTDAPSVDAATASGHSKDGPSVLPRLLSRGSVVTVVLLAVMSGLVYVAVHLRHVHDVGWEYRWNPSAAPPRISFEGRHYLRGSAESALPAGAVPLGRTPGGGVIYVLPGPHPTAPIGVEVVAHGHVTGYALSGGP